MKIVKFKIKRNPVYPENVLGSASATIFGFCAFGGKNPFKLRIMETLTSQQALLCKSYEGLFFTETICEGNSTIVSKTEKKPVPVDFHLALLIKKGIYFKIVDGRLFDKEIVYVLKGVKIRNMFNYE